MTVGRRFAITRPLPNQRKARLSRSGGIAAAAPRICPKVAVDARVFVCDFRSMNVDEEMTPQWLREQLQAPGRSQAALAKLMSVDTSAVNRMCKGAREIKLKDVAVIRQYLAETEGASASTRARIDNPDMAVTTLPNGKARLQINTVVPFSLALEILAKIEGAKE